MVQQTTIKYGLVPLFKERRFMSTAQWYGRSAERLCKMIMSFQQELVIYSNGWWWSNWWGWWSCFRILVRSKFVYCSSWHLQVRLETETEMGEHRSSWNGEFIFRGLGKLRLFKSTCLRVLMNVMGAMLNSLFQQLYCILNAELRAI